MAVYKRRANALELNEEDEDEEEEAVATGAASSSSAMRVDRRPPPPPGSLCGCFALRFVCTAARVPARCFGAIYAHDGAT